MPVQQNSNSLHAPEKADAVPPQNIEAEQAVLGSMLIEQTAEAPGIEKARALLKPSDFTRLEHQIIFSAAIALYERGEPVDLITLPKELKDNQAFAAAGSIVYLTSLYETVPTAANVEYYASIVAEMSTLRDAHAQFQRLANAALVPGANLSSLLKQAEYQCSRIAEQSPAARAALPKRLPLAERVKDMADIGPPPTDLPLLWWVLTEKSTHWLAAASGVGKSTVAFNIVTHLAEGNNLWGHPVKRPCRILYCDLESGEIVLKTKLEKLYLEEPRVRGGVFFLEDIDVAAEINSLLAFCQDKSIDLVVFDTAAKTWSLRDENDNSEVGRSVTPILETLKRAGIASLVIDHTGKNNRGSRGASAKAANVDVVLELELKGVNNDPNAIVMFECYKHKLLGFPKPLMLKRVGNDHFDVIDGNDAGLAASETDETPKKGVLCANDILAFLEEAKRPIKYREIVSRMVELGHAEGTAKHTITRLQQDEKRIKNFGGEGYTLVEEDE